MRWSTPLLGLLMLGCGTDELPSQYAPYTLVPGNNQTNAKYDGTRRDWVGELDVEEGTVDGAFTVTATVPGEIIEFDIRSRFGTYDGAVSTDPKKPAPKAENPNGLDLIGLLDGLKDVQIHLEEDGLTNDLSFAFVNADDELLYLTETAGESALTELIYGTNFVEAGESLGTAPAGETTLTLYNVRLRTDDGLVDAYPGFPVRIKKNNIAYVFLLVANWERAPNDAWSCPIDERLAYEMVQLDLVRGFDVKAAGEGIERGESESIDGGGCVQVAAQ